MAFVLVVPGRSDEIFLNNLRLRGQLANVGRIVRARTDDRLVDEAPAFQQDWARLGYTAVFVRDLELTGSGMPPCVDEVRGRFDPSIDRRNIVLARICLEAWYLADSAAINQHFRKRSSRYRSPADTATIRQPKAEIQRLLNEHYHPRAVSYVETEFAERFAPRFSVERALRHSSSLRRLVDRLNTQP